MANCTTCGSPDLPLIIDVQSLIDPLLADTQHIYRLPDGTLWALDKTQLNYQPFGGDVLYIETQDTNEITLTWDSGTRTLSANLSPSVRAQLAKIDAFPNMLPTFTDTDGFTTKLTNITYSEG